MEMLLQVGLLVSLCIIIYQDVSSRTVTLWSLLLLTGFASAVSIDNQGWQQTGMHFLFNIAFFLLQILLLSLYYSLKMGELTNIADRYLGWGDILYFLPLALSMPFLQMIWFYVVSLCLILVGFILYSLFQKGKETTIPLAGLLSVAWGGYLLLI